MFLAPCRLFAQTPDFATSEPVGRLATNRLFTPANQVLTPAGKQVELPELRPQGLALSPNGHLLVTSGKTPEIIVLDPASGNILERVSLPPESNRGATPGQVTSQILQPDKDGQLSFTGLVFSPDGTRLYLANVDGSVKVFAVDPAGQVSPLVSLPLPPANAPARKPEIPAGIAVAQDGKRLYVALNLSNRLAELDATDGRVLRLWDVGVEPYDVVLAGRKVYVSNWGGRRPEATSVTGPAGRGTLVRVDPVRYIASEGSVSVVSLDNPTSTSSEAELLTGLHASAMALSPDGRWLVVANAASDTLSVIDTRKDKIVETIWARQNPADLFGAQPNALVFDNSGQHLYVCNGSQNAVAVLKFKPGKSKLQGLIPVGWFPGAIVFDPHRRMLDVANVKGLSPGRRRKSDDRPEFNSHQYHGSLSLVPLPRADALAAGTKVALANMRYPLLAQAALKPRPGRAPVPVPERVGEPSLFKHVVYIIKENRTYDQVLGDVRGGNGDPELCTFGETVTPNQHKLVRQFLLLDNTYCSSILSADGHQWADTGIATDYMEKSFAGFPRSYPDGMEDSDIDALAYSPAGFIWDNAIGHGRTLRDYGEFAITETHWKDRARTDTPTFLDQFKDFSTQAGAIETWSRPAIESLRPFLATNTVGWDLSIPDVFRAEQFIRELKQYERAGQLPNLIILCLPNDHTSGTKAGLPTPAAQVADNDLALGQIIDALSHTKFWTETCVLAIEDDPQNGWDHVSGYRTTAYVVSPYSRLRHVVHTQYNHTSLLRTMELILGLPPMNQFDATATPMFDCFTSTPDLTPYEVAANQVPLNQLNPEPRKVSDRLLRHYATLSSRLPLEQPDRCPEDVLNRIIWHAVKGPNAPYPAWAVSVQDDD